MVEFRPAVRIKGGVAESVKEVFASFCVRVGDLHFWREEGGKVSVELGGILDLASEVRCAKLYHGWGDVCPGCEG